MEKRTSLPGGGLTAFSSSSWKRQRAPEINVVARQGITPEHDNPLIFVTPTLLGEEKGILPNAPQSCCVAVSCPWLIAAPVERTSACNAGAADYFHTSISGIVMSNQNAARHQSTLQPPHHSVR